MTLKKSEPARLCPGCSATDTILDNEPLWPRGWRCPTCGYAFVLRAEIPCLAPQLDGENVGFDPKSFASLAEIEEAHFWFQTRNDLIGWLLRRYAADARRILEVGCGTGFVLHALLTACPGASISGCDLHSAGLSFARARHGRAIELIQADARRLCLRGALDVVCALDVLEHIEEDEVVLGEICAALRKGGVLIAAVPQHPSLWSESDVLASHIQRYRMGEVEKKARAAGFEVRFADSFVSLLLPAMALSRIMSRITLGQKRDDTTRGRKDPVGRELRIGPSLNRVMRAILRLEHLLRRVGLRSPIGGSRVIVAQKLG